MFDHLKDKYLGIVANDAAQVAATATKRMFEQAIGDKPAEGPRTRTNDALPLREDVSEPAGYSAPPSVPTYSSVPSVPLTPYVPSAPTPFYQVDEDKLRSMARWKASVNLKYVETITRFARDIVGSMAANDAMVEMVERLERNDNSLSPEEVDMAEGMKKAVDKRRKIERTDSVILSDAEMRSIYEEIIFNQMREQNRRGELQLQSEKEFFWNLMLITMAEIGGAGKEVIAEKVSGAVKKVTAKRR